MQRMRFWLGLCVVAMLALTADAAKRTDAAKPAADRADKKAKNVAKFTSTPAALANATEARDIVSGVNSNAFVALRLAIEDLAKSFPDKYPQGAGYLKQLDALEKKFLAGGSADELRAPLLALRKQALLENPLLDFGKLMLVKRADPNNSQSGGLGLPQNWQGDDVLGGKFDNEIAVLSPVKPDGKLATLFRPQENVFIGDVDLNFDADKMLISMPVHKTVEVEQGGKKQKKGLPQQWHIWELKADGTGLRQLTPDEADIDHYDACYLPDGRILFDSTAGFQGVPCVGGGNFVGNLYQMDADGKNIRMLCYDQEHNWCPTVLNDGRVLYSRWEYTDTPHYFTRLLFAMNPDGTGQMAIYGSNSYWPNGVFYARPIPGHPSKLIGVISGHHGVPRMGELILFDMAKGNYEADGAAQRIPGRGKKVEPVITDGLVNSSWPKFLHPYPLNEKYFLVSCKPTPQSPWGVYLVDVFDNIVPLLEQPGWALFEPVPLRASARPPVIPDRVKLGEREATVYLTDVYTGKGMAGVPRGTVKNLRVFEYHFAYRRMGGHINIGVDGPWDVHRILGTVPVNADGSAFFKVPANTPIAVQPLDEQGRAVQIMRSWFSAQPGERLSCVGCHEKLNETPAPRGTLAARTAAVDITPWRGPRRGFSFPREVQPVLNKYCVGCHSGAARPDGKILPNFSPGREEVELGSKKKKVLPFDVAYLALHPFVRRPGPESDYHLPMTFEYHASTSELIQMLEKGHHGVQLDAEAWNRLTTWIDLNVPDHGTWGEHRAIENLKASIANVWPFDAAAAKRMQESAGLPKTKSVELSATQKLDLVLIPAGEFVMGDAADARDAQPTCRVKIDKPFYLARTEVCNALYREFELAHDSGVLSQFNKDHSKPGEPENLDRQPALRVSWLKAMAFCDWLSKKTGKQFTLPTEAQWEWACRAGTATPLNYGAPSADFGKLANLADQRLAGILVGNSPKWLPRVDSVNDGAICTAPCGNYAPNAWGLCDMHGNASEWTRTSYKPYPYKDDGRDRGDAEGFKVARGGSFYDRPQRATSAYRFAYPAWQPVFDIGFRVACEDVK
ncbi:MAG: SUMF1/EgtB/PvdO family nonheme iron enzyme [Kiritimatiellaeota bacterium]|nr:SUMF1/EgtB/PvdO family nonheme iron enzyme [Kiritimatiellota bacterium]